MARRPTQVTIPTWELTAKQHLRQYQWKAIKFGLKAPRNAMFLDMGLGKTTITLHQIKALKHKGELKQPVLIVAPIRVIHNVWRQEAAKWEHTTGLTFSIMHGNARKRLEAFNADVDIMLINPQNVVWLMDLLRDNGYGVRKFDYDRNAQEVAEGLSEPLKPWPFDMLVIDESSMFKKDSSKRWKALRFAAELFPRVSLLTGTPTPNTMLELWPQMYFIDKGARLGRTKIWFRDEFFYKFDYNGYDWRLRRGAEERINRLVSDVCMRLDAKDWLDMPEVLRNPIKVELPDDVMEAYTQFEEEMFIELLTSTVEAVNAASLSQRCHQYANGAMYSTDRETAVRTWEPVHDAKLEALEEVIDSAGGNVIVAYQFKHDLERLRQKYPQAAVLGGGIGVAETQRIIKDWNAGNIRILLVHPMSAGHGLNLQHGGHTIIFFSLTWSLEQHDQLIARLHRSGQTERVVVHYLIAKDTVDELIFAVLEGKARTQAQLLDALREYTLRQQELRSERRAA